MHKDWQKYHNEIINDESIQETVPNIRLALALACDKIAEKVDQIIELEKRLQRIIDLTEADDDEKLIDIWDIAAGPNDYVWTAKRDT